VIPVAALYIDLRGPYPAMGVDCYDEQRDAKTYAGPWPVVAHPPCGPWGRLKFLCKHQDPTCGPRAVEQVRNGGGVLEHPTGSTLWRHCGLPRPGDPPDAWGGFTLEVRQVAWGHCCAKPTWLYVVGVPPEIARAGVRTGGVETHRVTNGSRGKTHLPRCTALQARLSPPAFAVWLVSLALWAAHGRGLA
jgi:hypothetical protein